MINCSVVSKPNKYRQGVAAACLYMHLRDGNAWILVRHRSVAEQVSRLRWQSSMPCTQVNNDWIVTQQASSRDRSIGMHVEE
jgi:hypothetical protein